MATSMKTEKIDIPDLLRGLEGRPSRGAPPVDSWTPPFCGDIDMRIARDGTWYYRGTPILRPQMVRMFSSILRKDEEGYRLVTPVEKVAVTVEDAPFVVVSITVGTEGLNALTQVGDTVALGPLQPLRFESGAHDGLKPYVLVHGGLWALFSRAATTDLMNQAEVHPHEGDDWLGIASRGSFFPIAPARSLEDLA